MTIPAASVKPQTQQHKESAEKKRGIKFAKTPDNIEDIIGSDSDDSLPGHDLARTVSGFVRKGTVFMKN